MSSTIDYPECPNCGKTAYFEQDNKTCITYMSCQHCGYVVQDGKVIRNGKQSRKGKKTPKATTPKLFKTVIQIEVLSEGPYNPDSVSQIAYDIDEGDCSGKWTVKSSKSLTGKQMVKELEKQGSDAGFLGLDENGEYVG